MKKNIALTVVLFFIATKIISAQCNVKKVNLEKGFDRYSMTESFYENDNEDIADGIKAVFISLNYLGGKSNEKNPYLLDIVVTYAYSNYYDELTPNKLTMSLSSGKIIELTASEMSKGTINLLYQSPKNIKTIECKFDLSLENSLSLLESKMLDRLTVEDYKKNKSIDLSKKYKGQLPEMLSCVVN